MVGGWQAETGEGGLGKTLTGGNESGLEKKGTREEKQKLKQVTKKMRVSRGSGPGVRRRRRNPPQPGVSSLLRDGVGGGGSWPTAPCHCQRLAAGLRQPGGFRQEGLLWPRAPMQAEIRTPRLEARWTTSCWVLWDMDYTSLGPRVKPHNTAVRTVPEPKPREGCMTPGSPGLCRGACRRSAGAAPQAAARLQGSVTAFFPARTFI